MDPELAWRQAISFAVPFEVLKKYGNLGRATTVLTILSKPFTINELAKHHISPSTSKEKIMCSKNADPLESPLLVPTVVQLTSRARRSTV